MRKRPVGFTDTGFWRTWLEVLLSSFAIVWETACNHLGSETLTARNGRLVEIERISHGERSIDGHMWSKVRAQIMMRKRELIRK